MTVSEKKRNETLEVVQKIYDGFITRFVRDHVPKRFNQLKLLKELANPDIDHFMSISNRTDGKSTNYLHALLKIAIDYDLGISMLSRNMMLRVSYQELIEEIIEISDIFERKDFNFIRSQYYVILTYKGKKIGIIGALNDASELKNFSALLKHFPIIFYDEFLALESDYLSDEWERLEIIYKSIDRKEEYPLITKPKIFYMGNAVNFESPILFGLDIFNILEKHPMDTAKIYLYKFNIMLEIHRNEQANEQMNTRAFGGDENDSMVTARFKTNSHNVADNDDRYEITKNPRYIFVKLKEEYLKIAFNRDTFKIILSVVRNLPKDYDYAYNLKLKDNKPNSVYLTEKYFNERHIKKIDRGAYLFDNTYSKNYITNDFHDLNQLKIDKLMREILQQEKPEDELENKEKQFRQNYIEQTKRRLMDDLWG